jgi:tetratricopeptide (TPR) repeat protein
MVNLGKGSFDPRAARFQTLAGQADAAVRAGDLPRAIAAAKRAIAEGLSHPAFFNILAAGEMGEGRPREALDLIGKGLVLAPRDANLLNMKGVAHNNLGEYREAVRAFDRAADAAPRMAQPIYNRGLAYEGLGELNRSRADFERAVELQPNYPEARARLAFAEAVRGQLAPARAHAQRVLAANPRDPLAHIALAMADNAEDRFAATIARLTAMLPLYPPGQINRAIALGLLGDAYDATGDASRAFDAYEQSKAILKDLYAPVYAEAPALAQAEMLHAYFAPAPAARWTADLSAPADPTVAGHVFLVGFPRSGTTLLEQTLAGHAAVVTSEERDLLAGALDDLTTTPAGLDRLAALTPDEIAKRRARYWTLAREAGLKPAGKLFVDKLPLNALLLPAVARLFPHAKILFALRDPRDVVFSCFRRKFDMSPQMYQLVTLQGAADYYDAVMRISMLYRETLGLAWREVRHEDFVRGYADEARAVCAWLGLGWDANMMGVAERLRGRAVNTPSTMQIARGVSTEGFGAWRRYAAKMPDVLARLQPWVTRFGYGDTP